MLISRVQVEEGFLDGLDLSLEPGLNVIIGARGVGKTSILELIRYALRLEHVDDRRASAATQHAEAILAGGRVTLTCLEGDKRYTVARTANDLAGPSIGIDGGEAPLMLGQNELEGIGLDPRSRLRLVDAHAGIDRAVADAELGRLSAEVVSLTLQLRDLNLQRDGLRQQELIRAAVARDLEAARQIEAELLSRASADIAQLRDRLGVAATQSAKLKRQISAAESLSQGVNALADRAEALATAIADLAAETVDKALTKYGAVLTELRQQQLANLDSLRALSASIGNDVQQDRQAVRDLDDEMRPFRREFEEFEVGAGASAQATSRLEQQLAEIDATLARSDLIEQKVTDLLRQRAALMGRVDSVREAWWQERERAAARLNELFLPRIRVDLEHYGDRTAYISALSAALRGSGLQHNQVAEWLADRVSPQELVDAVEAADAAKLSVLGEITSARVEKLVSHLGNSELLGSVLTAQVDDRVGFQLLVGRDYKATEGLSTGQRCAVVLPLLLADEGRTLLLDQPEDHLDNAYLVENTVRTLHARSGTAQTLVVTHNANIPVLGDASNVVCLESDGRRGFVRDAGPLASPRIVQAITELMEGGHEAFARRARFYAEPIR